MWTCLNDGPEKLTDGAIFVRADGETRLAKGAEIRAMVDRSRQHTVTAELDVSVVGRAVRHPHGYDQVLEDYIRAHRNSLGETSARGRIRARTFGWNDQLASFAFSDRRSPEQFLAEVESWEQEVRQAWPAFLDYLASYAGHGTVLRIRNTSDAFLENVQVQVYIEGEATAVDPVEPDRVDLASQLPDLPVRWGADTLLSSSVALGRYLGGDVFRPAAAGNGAVPQRRVDDAHGDTGRAPTPKRV